MVKIDICSGRRELQKEGNGNIHTALRFQNRSVNLHPKYFIIEGEKKGDKGCHTRIAGSLGMFCGGDGCDGSSSATLMSLTSLPRNTMKVNFCCEGGMNLSTLRSSVPKEKTFSNAIVDCSGLISCSVPT